MDAESAASLLAFADEARTGLTRLDGDIVHAALEIDDPSCSRPSNDRPDEAFQLADALLPFWMATKRIDEGDDWFDRIVALPGGSPTARARAPSTTTATCSTCRATTTARMHTCARALPVDEAICYAQA